MPTPTFKLFLTNTLSRLDKLQRSCHHPFVQIPLVQNPFSRTLSKFKSCPNFLASRYLFLFNFLAKIYLCLHSAFYPLNHYEINQYEINHSLDQPM